MTPHADVGSSARGRWWLAAALTAVVAATWAGWSTGRNPRVAYLADHRPARWIVFPRVARIGIRPAVEIAARFRRTFVLGGETDGASLEYRAFRRAEIRVNGVKLPATSEDSGSWKRSRTLDIGRYVRPGENEITVSVHNDRGPPALWLALRVAGEAFETDESWSSSLAGSVWRPAELATEAYYPERIDPDAMRVDPRSALRDRWGALTLFALIATAVLLAVWTAERVLARHATRIGSREILLRALLSLVLASWIAMVVNNAPSLWVGDGFDAPEHLEYVQFVLDHHRLPLPEQGWAMFQPPLYYVLAATALGAVGIGTAGPATGTVLRMFSLALGVAQLLLIFGCLRSVFPSRPRAQAIGLIVAGFVPLQLYMFQYVGNDALAAVLSTASLYLGLRILAGEASSIRAHGVLGAVMGLALLAKLSAVVVVAVLLGTMVGKAISERRRIPELLGSAGVTALACGAVSGWHYGKLWWRYGSPLIGNWDPAIGSPWWQDPGVLTARFYTRFGQALTTPLLSAYNSLADGLYSSLWGEGLIGGRGEIALAPPWNFDLMALGYLLALVPTLLAATGAGVLVARLVRQPSATGFVVVGCAAATAMALVVWPLKIPIYSVIKASFGMPALLSLCAFAAAGFEFLARAPAARRIGLGILLVWAMTSYATFWIPRGDATAEGRLGWILAQSGVTRGNAPRHLRAAREADPGQPLARLGVAALASSSGEPNDAIAVLREVVSSHPEGVRGRLELARLLASRGALDEALTHLRGALDRNPDLAQAHAASGEILALVGRRGEAIKHYREALRAVPESSVVHRELGTVLLEVGRAEEGRWHLRESDRLDAASWGRGSRSSNRSPAAP